MATKKFPKIKVSRKYKQLSVPALGSFAKGTVFTGDPDATTPPNNDTQIHALADTVLTTHTSRQTSSSKTLSASEHEQRDILIEALDENANYLENVANKVAKANGDINAGYAVVTRIGFQYTNKTGAKRNTGITDVGIGWVHAHEAKSKKGVEGHIWEGGTTTAKSIPPTSVNRAYTLEADCIFSNLASGTIFAYRHASIVPVAHSAKTSTPATPHSSVSKTASVIPMSKAKHPVIDFNKPIAYQFGEWRYVVVP